MTKNPQSGFGSIRGSHVPRTTWGPHEPLLSQRSQNPQITRLGLLSSPIDILWEKLSQVHTMTKKILALFLPCHSKSILIEFSFLAAGRTVKIQRHLLSRAKAGSLRFAPLAGMTDAQGKLVNQRRRARGRLHHLPTPCFLRTTEPP